jgi:4-amino-4-deoxy-L-arabinose transferase-like glycosyltransferase
VTAPSVAGSAISPLATDRIRTRPAAAEIASVVALVAIAAVVRLWSLPTRGTWDADQGTEMLVLLDLVRDHVVPLLGPSTSIGGFHHGVLYYWLLAPAALVSDADPVAIAAEIALLGAAAVLPVWWMARSVAGRWAGLAAGLLWAVSATSIAGSTAIWNPSLTAPAAALTLAAAWYAATAGRSRWWLVAGAGLALAMHAHVLAAALVVPLPGLFVWARRSVSFEARPSWWIGLAAVGVVAASYLPLLVYDLGHDFAETRALVAFVAGGSTASSGGGSALGPIVALMLVAVRSIAWPLTGLITLGPAAPLPALLATIGTIVAIAWLIRSGGHRPRLAAIWLGLTLGWSALALTVAAPALQTVVPALPVDQYHAFLDPVVIVVVACALATVGPRIHTRIAAALVLVALGGWNVAHWPPAVAADGGWPAAEATAAELAGQLPEGEAVSVVSLPSFKPPDAYVFPLERLGVEVVDGAGGDAMVVVCDQLFREAIGADCGGAAEDARVAPLGLHLMSRTEAAPGRWVSLYRVRGG